MDFLGIVVITIAASFIVGPAFALFFEWCQKLGYKRRRFFRD